MKKYELPKIEITKNLTNETICNEIKTTSVWDWVDDPSLKEDF